MLLRIKVHDQHNVFDWNIENKRMPVAVNPNNSTSKTTTEIKKFVIKYLFPTTEMHKVNVLFSCCVYWSQWIWLRFCAWGNKTSAWRIYKVSIREKHENEKKNTQFELVKNYGYLWLYVRCMPLIKTISWFNAWEIAFIRFGFVR